jgi:hypothetical protein
VPHRDAEGKAFLFSVKESGEAVNIHPAGNEPALDTGTVFCCSGCVWSGTIAQLKEEQR